jgi:hypothetical protein
MNFFDLFDRPDENLEASASYTHAGQAGAAAIRGNRLSSNTVAVGVYLVPDQGSSAHYTQASFYGTAGAVGFITVRTSDVNNWIGLRYAIGAWQMYKFVAGAATLLGSYTVAAVAGDVGRIEADAYNNVRVYVNGTLRISVVESFNSTISRQGVVAGGAIVNPWIDNLNCGPLNSIVGIGDTLTTVNGAGAIGYGNAITGLGDTLTTINGAGAIGYGNAIHGSGDTLITANGQGIIAYGNAITGHGDTLATTTGHGSIPEPPQEFIHMRKLFLLRQHLLQFPGKPKIEPDNLDIFADKGKIMSYRGDTHNNNHYQWLYSANVVVKDFSGNADQLMIYLLGWIDQYQPDRTEDALEFEADILNQKTADLAITIKLSEVVEVQHTPAGIVLKNATEPDARIPLLPALDWSMTGNNEPLAQWLQNGN